MLVQCYPTPKNGGETNKKGEKCEKLAATPLNTHNPEWITAVTPSDNDGFTHN